MARKNKKIMDWKVLCVAVIVLGVMQIFAMHYGINGTFRTYIVGAILLALGVALPNPLKK